MKNQNQKNAAVEAEKKPKKNYKTRPSLIAEAKVREREMNDLKIDNVNLTDLISTGNKTSDELKCKNELQKKKIAELQATVAQGEKDLRGVKGYYNNHLKKTSEIETILEETKMESTLYKKASDKNTGKVEKLDKMSFFKLLPFLLGRRTFRTYFFD